VAKKPPKPTLIAAEDGPITAEMLQAMLSQMLASRTTDAVDEAQEIMFEAWECEVPKRRIALARKALKISADCADAYLLLAEEGALTPAAALDLLVQAVAAGERALGPAAFVEDVGHFWGLLETRPYMRARLALALALWGAGNRDEAAEHLIDMIRLNPNDNQGVRYQLINWLIILDRRGALDALLRLFKDSGDAQWTFPAALAAFQRKGDTAATRKALVKAQAANPHITAYLTGRRRPPKVTPPYYSPGSQDEAAIYFAGGGREAWIAVPGALAWLKGDKRTTDGLTGQGAPSKSPPGADSASWKHSLTFERGCQTKHEHDETQVAEAAVAPIRDLRF
jgi:tetratricopeptide (TPR) repeat protein